jgi:L-cysteine S-thiosulfotransferase
MTIMKLKTAIVLAAGFAAMCAYASAFSGEVFSGYTLLKQETKDMQDDDFMNPGMEAVAKGAAMFSTQGKKGVSCASCHGEGGKKLDPKHIAQYPVLDSKTKRPITLQQRIINEWTEQLGKAPLQYESGDALALEAFVRNLARGQVVNVQIDGAMAAFYEEGEKLYETRAGQLNMACNLCHENYAGQKLRAQVLSQGQTNGFPLYRLATGTLTGIQTRFNQCYDAFRAKPYPFGSEEYTLLELYANARGNGLKIETPAVRF